MVRPGHFRADVAEPIAGAAATYDLAQAVELCQPARSPAGERTVAVRYDGALAALVYHARTDDGQRVDLYLCGDRDGESGPVRSVVLRSP